MRRRVKVDVKTNEVKDVYIHASIYNACHVSWNVLQETLSEKSLGIKWKHLPPDHPDLGRSYNNIGNVHYSLGQYDLALEHYNRSLAIRLRSFPPQHPNIAMTYNNMGAVYAEKGELERALTYLQKASAIFHHSLPFQHPDVLSIDQAIEHVLDKVQPL